MELTPWLYCYDFKYSYFLNDYISQIIEGYNNKEKSNTNDFLLDIKPVKDFLLPKISKIANDNFYLGDSLEESEIWTYVQPPSNNLDEIYNYHNHAHNAGNICGVFYLNLPKQGGGFQVENSPWLDPTIIKPEVDKLYLFPFWLSHRPLPHDEDIFRISFNWTFKGNIRATNKFNGMLW